MYDTNLTLFYSIPGVRVGCYIVEATLQSSLIAFYNQTWLDDYRHQTYFIGPLGKVKALNSSINQNFMIDTTIKTIVENLMIDGWSMKNVSFSKYYDQCQPATCKYTYEKTNDITYIITTSKYYICLGI